MTRRLDDAIADGRRLASDLRALGRDIEGWRAIDPDERDRVARALDCYAWSDRVRNIVQLLCSLREPRDG